MTFAANALIHNQDGCATPCAINFSHRLQLHCAIILNQRRRCRKQNERLNAEGKEQRAAFIRAAIRQLLVFLRGIVGHKKHKKSQSALRLFVSFRVVRGHASLVAVLPRCDIRGGLIRTTNRQLLVFPARFAHSSFGFVSDFDIRISALVGLCRAVFIREIRG
jgi:hypothetical protein